MRFHRNIFRIGLENGWRDPRRSDPLRCLYYENPSMSRSYRTGRFIGALLSWLPCPIGEYGIR
jgi:hypothetical protein